MRKTIAIQLLGGTITAAAKKIGISYQAVNQWPDDLSSAVTDRVLAVLAREHLPAQMLAELSQRSAADVGG